jgi:hypothetical protein
MGKVDEGVTDGKEDGSRPFVTTLAARLSNPSKL